MPVIVSIESIPDGGGGLRIVTSVGEVIQITKADLPGNVRNGTAQEIENYCNNWLVNKLPKTNYSFSAQVHVLTTTPLTMQTIVVNEGEIIPSDWWVDKKP